MKSHSHARLAVVSMFTLLALGACGDDEAPSNPSRCGDGTVDTAAGEECDGTNLNGGSCATATMNTRPNGVLACSATSCKFDMTQCLGAPAGSGGSTPTGTGGSIPLPPPGAGGRTGAGGAQVGTGGGI